ncbi:MAG: hypothetical protein QM726_01180 [Chitinophagaceae bacterium]
MNTLAYIIYLFITYIITVRTGLVFYKNGKYYIIALVKGDESLANAINKTLLTGYYLLNLGYAALMLTSWQTVSSFTTLMSSVGMMTGKIMLTLGVVHFFNMAAIYYISKRNNHLINHTN